MWNRVVAGVAIGLMAVVLLGSLSGCAGRPSRDGPPSRPPADLARTPDAVPRAETPSRYGNPREYVVFGQRYRTLPTNAGYDEIGIASWYGAQFHGQRTSSGETYDMYAMTAAHRSLPLPSYVEVTNLENQRRVVVRVNDRGPFVDGRIIDLSYAAAYRLGIAGSGLARVRVRAVGPEVRMAWAGPDTPPAVASAPVRGRDPTVPRGVASGAASAAGVRFVQVGAFAARDNAEALRRRLEREGLRPVRIDVVATASGRVHRVRIGPLADTDAQHAVESALVRLAHRDYRVVVE